MEKNLPITSARNYARSGWTIGAGLLLLTATYAFGSWILGARGLATPSAIDAFWTIALRLFLVAWVRADRQVHAFGAPYEFDAFLFFASAVVLLYYLCKTRGPRGILLWVGIFFVLALPDVVQAYFQIAHSIR